MEYLGNLKFGEDMQRVSAGFVGIGLWIVTVSTGWAITITEPKAGAVFHPGDKVMVRVEADEGEVLKHVLIWPLKNGGSGVYLVPPYKLEFTIKPTFLGIEEISVSGKLPNGDLVEAEVPITVVLPPTTKIVSIGADFDGRNETFLQIARKPNGDFVPSGSANENTLSISADYSDGVARDIKNNPDVTYKSLNEKVAIVILPGKEGNPYDELALVKATGPGKTSIIVQYGEFTDRVTVNVKECPYTEGMKRCPR
jgi:hypothetical protein